MHSVDKQTMSHTSNPPHCRQTAATECRFRSDHRAQPLPRQVRRLSWQIGLSYPSPPMSSPPSPTKQFSTIPEPSSPVDVSMLSVASREPQYNFGHSNPTAESLEPALYHQTQQQIFRVNQPSNPTTTSRAQLPPLLTTIEERPVQQAGAPIPERPSPPDSVLNAGPERTSVSASRGGRRSKAHVANACGNCKRAHLSCDVQRPCNRCVATGKQDTCRDVPHKKRGRPRLREDTEFQVESSTRPLERPFEPTPANVAPPGDRPMASLRHRRGDSLRTLKSYGSSPSASSSVVSPTYGRPASRSIHEIAPPTLVTPIAFMDLDLVIIKANAAFYQLFAGLQELRGRRLTDIARPADADSFQLVRNRLREERELREPAYLPPILSSGHDPLNGTSERNVDQVTRGFQDRQYIWTYSLASGVEQTLATRIRLAKSSVYFVTLALPPFPQSRHHYQPGIGQAPPSPTLTSPTTISIGPHQSSFQAIPPLGAPRSRRNTIAQSAPPSPFFPYQSPMYVGPGHPQAPPSIGSQGSAGSPSSSRTYPPPQQQISYGQPPQMQQQQQQYGQYRSPPFLPQMQPVAEPTAIAPASDPFTPRFLSRRLSQPLPPPTVPFGAPSGGGGAVITGLGIVQRSPTMGMSGEAAGGASSVAAIGAGQGRQLSTSSESGGERGSPKKRLRMEIGDVLQK